MAPIDGEPSAPSDPPQRSAKTIRQIEEEQKLVQQWEEREKEANERLAKAEERQAELANEAAAAQRDAIKARNEIKVHKRIIEYAEKKPSSGVSKDKAKVRAPKSPEEKKQTLAKMKTRMELARQHYVKFNVVKNLEGKARANGEKVLTEMTAKVADIQAPISARIGRSPLLFTLVMLSVGLTAVITALTAYDVTKSFVARHLRGQFVWLDDVARHDDRLAFFEWVSEMCDRPHLQESLICQATHMDYGVSGMKKPENWLVRQLALLKVMERGVDFCPGHAHGKGLMDVRDKVLGKLWLRATLGAAGALGTVDARELLRRMAEGEIPLSRLDDEIAKIPAYSKWLKKVLHGPLAAWGIRLADPEPPTLKCNVKKRRPAGRPVIIGFLAFGLVAVLGGVELIARDLKPTQAGKLFYLLPVRLVSSVFSLLASVLGAAALAVKATASALSTAKGWLQDHLAQPLKWAADWLWPPLEFAMLLPILIIGLLVDESITNKFVGFRHWRGVFGGTAASLGVLAVCMSVYLTDWSVMPDYVDD